MSTPRDLPPTEPERKTTERLVIHSGNAEAASPTPAEKAEAPSTAPSEPVPDAGAGEGVSLSAAELQEALARRDRGERVYAPASERVPRTPPEGDAEFMAEHYDPDTRERKTAEQSDAS